MQAVHKIKKEILTFCVAPLRKPLSHKERLPEGSSSTWSVTSLGRRNYEVAMVTKPRPQRKLTMVMFPNLSALATVL